MAKFKFDLTPSIAAVTHGAWSGGWHETFKGSVGARDDLQFIGTGDMHLGVGALAGARSIEMLDFRSAALDSFVMSLSQALVDQADGKILRILVGENDVDRLDLTAVTNGTVTFSGTGTVHLADAAKGLSNVLRLSGDDIDAVGGAGTDVILGSSGDNVIAGGGGADTLTGGRGDDVFVVGKGGGVDRIVDFKLNDDSLLLKGFGFKHIDEVLARASAFDGGVRIDLGGGDAVELAKVKMSALAAIELVIDNSGIAAPVPANLVAVGTTAAQLNALIAKAAPGAEIVLANGVHVFDQTILIERGEITLRGQSEAGTVVKFAMPEARVGNGIEIKSDVSTEIGTLAGNTAPGQTFIRMAPGHEVKAGDTLFISQDNDAGLRATGLYDNVPDSYWNKLPMREALVQVSAVDGDKIFLSSPLQQAFGAGKATVASETLLKNVTLSDLTVTYDLGPVASEYFFSDMKPKYAGSTAIDVHGTLGAQFRNLTVKDAASHGFQFAHSIGISADRLSTDGAHNKAGGSGYGIQIAEVFDSRFTGLELLNNRHAFVFSSWHSEANNHVEIANTDRDVNFHGGIDRNNSVIVQNQVLDYKPWLNNGADLGAWNPVNGGGGHHPDTDIWGDNTVLHAHAVASIRNDEIHAVDGGASLDGGAGHDILFGGKGADTILGGTGNDRLFGAAGDDALDGGDTNDMLDGGDGADTLAGGAGQDILTGGAGRDTLSGGLGIDQLTGGAGGDVFVFTATAESGVGSRADRILDFAAGDTIDVRAIDAVQGGGDDAFVLDTGGAFVAGEIRQTVSGGDLIVTFNVDRDSSAEMAVTLVGYTEFLAASHFVL